MVRTTGCEAKNYYIAIRNGRKIYQTLTGNKLDMSDPASSNVANASNQSEKECTDLKFVKDCAGNPTETLRFHELTVGTDNHQVDQSFERKVIDGSKKYVERDNDYTYNDLEASLEQQDKESSAKNSGPCSKGGKKSRRKSRRSKKSHRKSSKKQRKSRRGGKSRRGRR